MREYADTRSKTLWPSDGEGNGTRAIPKNDLYTGSLFVTERGLVSRLNKSINIKVYNNRIYISVSSTLFCILIF